MDTLERPQDAVSHYTYRVAWSSEDDEFVATVAEFPSLSWLAPSQFGALEGLQTLLADVVVDMKEQGEGVPEPLSERKYSGKFNLRLGEKQAPRRGSLRWRSRLPKDAVGDGLFEPCTI